MLGGVFTEKNKKKLLKIKKVGLKSKQIFTWSPEFSAGGISSTIDPERSSVDFFTGKVPHGTHCCLSILILTEPEASWTSSSRIIDQSISNIIIYNEPCTYYNT